MKRTHKFIGDYRKILKEKEGIVLGNLDIVQEVEGILQEFGVLQENYRQI